jgi:O-methyltransferase
MGEIDSLKAAVRVAGRKVARLTRMRQPMFHPSYSHAVARDIERHFDDVRFATVALALQRLDQEKIAGAFAELGVYRGVLSAFIHRHSPDRRLYLFDTFEGFPQQALEEGVDDRRFRDTSQELVAKVIGDTRNVDFRKGYFPDSAAGLEQESFAFVMLDFDLFVSAKAALEFFYPRIVPGGYFFLHDFNNMESNRAISRAASEFLSDKPELLIEIPDICGSAVFRKLK